MSETILRLGEKNTLDPFQSIMLFRCSCRNFFRDMAVLRIENHSYNLRLLLKKKAYFLDNITNSKVS